MSEKIEDKLMMIAEYMDFNQYSHINPDYDNSWDWQIPVWAKLYLTYAKDIDRLHYSIAIGTNDPLKGFEIICKIIEQINKKQ